METVGIESLATIHRFWNFIDWYFCNVAIRKISKMSIENVSDNTLFNWLETSPRLLNSLNLRLSSITANTIIQQIRSEIPSINGSTLNRQFHDLQDKVDVEFSRRSVYSRNIFLQLQRSVRRSLATNLREAQTTFQTNTRLDRWEQRRRAYRIIDKFRNTVLRGHQDNEDKLIGISYAYLSLANGIYRFCLQDCYAWERLGRGESVDPDSLVHFEIHEIYNYYKDNGLPMFYFHGWDPTIRNAVSHANLNYDEATQKMTFVNEPREVDKKRVSEYEFLEIVENYEKILEIYQLVLVMNQVLSISSGCVEFIRRYP